MILGSLISLIIPTFHVGDDMFKKICRSVAEVPYLRHKVRGTHPKKQNILAEGGHGDLFG